MCTLNSIFRYAIYIAITIPKKTLKNTVFYGINASGCGIFPH